MWGNFLVQDGSPSLHSEWVLQKHCPPASAFSRKSLKDRLALSMPSSGRRAGKAGSVPLPGPLLEDSVARQAAQGPLLSLPDVTPFTGVYGVGPTESGRRGLLGFPL